MNTSCSCLSFLLLLSSSFTSLGCLVLFLGSDDNLKEDKTDFVFVISMGIVGVKSTAGREVKFVDPSMTTRGESAWLGYTLCDLSRSFFLLAVCWTDGSSSSSSS